MGRATNNYTTSQRYKHYINNGFKPIKEYDYFVLFEKIDHGKPLYRECVHKFELFGSVWTGVTKKKRSGQSYGLWD